jgi:hypothetical protein
MADDHSGTVGDIRLMSYVEIATARGITRRSATRLVFKSGWRRIRSNTGQTLVHVPVSALAPRETGPDAERGTGHDGGMVTFQTALEALQEAHRGHVAALEATIVAQGQLIAAAELRTTELQAALERARRPWWRRLRRR